MTTKIPTYFSEISDPRITGRCLHKYGLSILSELAEKKIVIDGKKQRAASPTTKRNKGLYLLNVWVNENEPKFAYFNALARRH